MNKLNNKWQIPYMGSRFGDKLAASIRQETDWYTSDGVQVNETEG